MTISTDILRELCAAEKIKWTTHVVVRMQERGIQPSDVRCCIVNGEIIEHYPNAYPYPACLIFGMTINDEFLHVVIGYGENKLWLITAYYPDEIDWENDFKTRKGQ